MIHGLIDRSQETLAIDSELPISITDPPVLTKTETDVESNHKLAISHPDAVADITSLDSKAIVVVPAMNAEALAVVPLNQKSRRAEMAQRRTRRPFSVSEVESLVQAVEELGTGRYYKSRPLLKFSLLYFHFRHIKILIQFFAGGVM